jgi:hypothetical protein
LVGIGVRQSNVLPTKTMPLSLANTTREHAFTLIGNNIINAASPIFNNFIINRLVLIMNILQLQRLSACFGS